MYLDSPQPPNLPFSPIEFSSQYQEQLNNALRLYFNRLSNVTKYLLGPEGGQYLNMPFAEFFDTTDQIAASTTAANVINFSNTTLSNGITTQNSNKIVFEYGGVYNLQYSIQLANDDNATQDIDIWFSKNGTNESNSNRRYGLSPRKSSGDPYHTVACANYTNSFVANDYVQLNWRTSNTAAYLEHYTASASPTRPAVPSVIVTATFVSSVPE